MEKKKRGRPRKHPEIIRNEKAGAPCLYKEEYNDQVYKLCLLGAKDKEIAYFFGVVESTLNKWKIDFPKFSESIREGKTISDMKVADALYKSTQDRIVIEQVPFKTKSVFYEEGKRIEKEQIEIASVEKVIPADFRSQSFWLRNRKSDVWRDKQEVEHSVAMSSDEREKMLMEILEKTKK